MQTSWDEKKPGMLRNRPVWWRIMGRGNFSSPMAEVVMEDEIGKVRRTVFQRVAT